MAEVIIINPLPLMQLAASKVAYAILADIIKGIVDEAPHITLDELDELYPDE
jgi:hypothetical protein